MSQETIDYGIVLADLKRRREEAVLVVKGLEAAIAAIEKSVVIPSVRAQVAATVQASVDPARIKADTFKKMTFTDGAYKYLEMTGGPQALRSVVDALIAGGIKSKSARPYATLYSAVRRDKRFRQFGKQWGLAQWATSQRPQEADAEG